ncbi:MAG: response regulator transcription factor [Clostridia bacterium]|nr:response regulator transcription factor [Clostridia bacterium]
MLVVEDDFGARKLMTVVLKNAGYKPLPAENSAVALELLDTEKPDLALVDIMLPDMDGFRLTETIRRKNKDIPIIMVTAKQSPYDKRYGFMVGADDYMTKPVDEEELILRIKVHLRRSKSESEQKLEFGNLLLDYSKMSAFVDGNDILLTQKEFLILFKLLSSVGKILTRNQLMEEIWGNAEQDDHTLNVHVSKIREKIENSTKVEIKSVRGLGYKAVVNEG